MQSFHPISGKLAYDLLDHFNSVAVIDQQAVLWHQARKTEMSELIGLLFNCHHLNDGELGQTSRCSGRSRRFQHKPSSAQTIQFCLCLQYSLLAASQQSRVTARSRRRFIFKPKLENVSGRLRRRWSNPDRFPPAHEVRVARSNILDHS